MRAFSTRFVKVVSSTTACALACFTREGLIKRVILFLSSFDILEILRLIEVLIKLQLVQLVQYVLQSINILLRYDYNLIEVIKSMGRATGSMNHQQPS